MNSWHRRIADFATLFAVAALSFAVLLFVAFGSTLRTFEQAHVDRVSGMAALMKGSIEGHLRTGLSLDQVIGIERIIVPVVGVDPLISSAAVVDRDGKTVFMHGTAAATTTGAGTAQAAAGNSQYLSVTLPLYDKFEQAGSLKIGLDRLKIRKHVELLLRPAVLVAALGALVIGLLAGLDMRDTWRRRRRWIAINFTIAFASVSMTVMIAMIAVFSDGAQLKGEMLANSLAQRLGDIPSYGLSLQHIGGIDDLLHSYRAANPGIAESAIVVGGAVAHRSGSGLTGGRWQREPANFEYRARVSGATEGGAKDANAIEVIIALPRAIVYRQVARNMKDFAALFVASIIIAMMVIQSAQAMRERTLRLMPGDPLAREGIAISLIRLVFFATVMVDFLSYAFLPRLVADAAAAAGLGEAFAALPFTVYFASVALAFIPARMLSARFGSATVMMWGLALVFAGTLAMAVSGDYWTILGARFTSGLGQGLMLIGTQDHLFAVVGRQRRTKAGAVIVIAFQSAMIAGIALGSLLAVQIESRGVFLLGAGITFCMLAFAYVALPRVAAPRQAGARPLRRLYGAARGALKDRHFMAAVSLVGLPAKMVLSGVVVFALPLLLGAKGFSGEDIGQISMIYAAAVILASRFVSDANGRHGGADRVLFTGTLLASVGLALIGLTGTSAVSAPNMAMLAIAGAALIGLAHGFINAPVVTFAANTQVAGRADAADLATVYRLMERVGHAAGPVLVSQLFWLKGMSPAVLFWVAAGVGILGALFLLLERAFPHHQVIEEAA